MMAALHMLILASLKNNRPHKKLIDTFKKKDNFYNQDKRTEGKEKHDILIFQDFTLFFKITLETPLFFLQLGTASR